MRFGVFLVQHGCRNIPINTYAATIFATTHAMQELTAVPFGHKTLPQRHKFTRPRLLSCQKRYICTRWKPPAVMPDRYAGTSQRIIT